MKCASDLTPDAARAALSPIDCFLLDMDGTFYLGDRVLPGAMEFLRKVEETGRQYLFLTNNSSKSVAHYVQKLAKLGLRVDKSRILSSGQATAQFLNRELPGKSIYLLGNSSLAQEMVSHGIHLTEAAPDLVVIGYDTTLTYEKLCKVCDFVRAGLPYIATHPDLNCPVEGGFEPDIGAVIAFIEASTGRRPDLIVGKPHGEIVRAACEQTGVAKSRMAMVGDRLYTDIRTGVDHGLTSILVLTGESTEADITVYGIEPHLIFEKLGDMAQYICPQG